MVHDRGQSHRVSFGQTVRSLVYRLVNVCQIHHTFLECQRIFHDGPWSESKSELLKSKPVHIEVEEDKLMSTIVLFNGASAKVFHHFQIHPVQK